MKLGVLIVLFVAFAAFSVDVMIGKGPIGFFPLAAAEPWALQMLLDLTILVSAFGVWMISDARKLGINGWLFVPLLPAGSVGALAYLIRRELAKRAHP